MFNSPISRRAVLAAVTLSVLQARAQAQAQPTQEQILPGECDQYDGKEIDMLLHTPCPESNDESGITTKFNHSISHASVLIMSIPYRLGTTIAIITEY